MNSLINFMFAATTSISVSSASNNYNNDSNKDQYVDDIRLVYAKSESDATSQLKDGYELVGDGALYNNADSYGNTYLAIKRTSDIKKAITDIRAANMYSNWSTSSYKEALNDLSQNIESYVNSIKPSIEEFREKYPLALEKEKEGITTGTSFAACVFDIFYDDYLINEETFLPYTILDIFTNDELYNDTNLKRLFLEGNPDALLSIETALIYSSCSFVKDGEKCFYLDYFEEYESLEDCYDSDYDDPINEIELEQMVECINSLKETLEPYVKSGFIDENVTFSEEDYENYLNTLSSTEAVEFYNASRIYLLLNSINFLDSTLSDFIINFDSNDNDFDINVVKPFILALSPAQRAIVPYCGLEAIFVAKFIESTTITNEFGETSSYYHYLKELLMHDLNLLGNGKTSFYYKINKEIFNSDNIALTSAAQRQNAAKGDFDYYESSNDSITNNCIYFLISTFTCISSFALGIGCIALNSKYKKILIEVKEMTHLFEELKVIRPIVTKTVTENDYIFIKYLEKISVDTNFLDAAKFSGSGDKFYCFRPTDNPKDYILDIDKTKPNNKYICSVVAPEYKQKVGKINHFSSNQDSKIVSIVGDGNYHEGIYADSNNGFDKKIRSYKNNCKNSAIYLKFGSKLLISFSVIGSLVFGVSLVFMIMKVVNSNSSKKTYETIPDLMFDEITFNGEASYISYSVFKDFDDKNADITQAEKRNHDEWVNLFFTKDIKAGNPLLADSFESSNKLDNSNEFLRKFGESGACNLTKFISSKNNGNVYLTYESVESLILAKQIALIDLENYAYTSMSILLGNSKSIYNKYVEKINSCGSINDVSKTLMEAMNLLSNEKEKNYDFAYPVYDFINSLVDSTDLNSDIVLARTSYEKLTSEQKEYIENIDILINLENEHAEEVLEVNKSILLNEIKTYINSLEGFNIKEKEELYNNSQNEIYNAKTQNELSYAKSNCYSNIENALKDKEASAASSFGQGNLGLLFLGLGGGIILGAAGLYVTLKFLKNKKKEEN